MAIPQLNYRGDMVVMTDWESNDTFVPFCGASSISISWENAIQEVTVTDCNDWTLAAKTIASYGAQTVTMTINATLAKSNSNYIIRWANDQMIVPVRIYIVGAPTGQVEYIDGIAMLPTYSMDNMGSPDNVPISAALNLRMKDGVTLTDAT